MNSEEIVTMADIREALGVGHKPMLSEIPGIIRELKQLSESRLENIKAMSSFLDDVATALGVAKPGTPVEGIGACWNVMSKIAELQDNIARLLEPEWRDVGTLPKIDPESCRSNDLLGCWPNGSMMVVYLDVCNGWMDSEGGEACVTMPTHWQPLPEPPQQPESV